MGGAKAALAIVMAGGTLLGGCLGGAPHISRPALIERIGGDAAAFNEAYGRAVNAQILLNILRSRDRQPRYYLSTTGISDAPSFLYGDNAAIGSLPVGEQRFQPWGVGSLGARREVTSRPSYAVQPLDAKTLTRAVFQPTPNNVFAHYWESGWPKDILLLLMVHKISVTRAGQTRAYTNEANDIRDDCRAGVDSAGCAYVREVRALIEAAGGEEQASAGPQAKAMCGLIAAYRLAAPVRAAGASADECAPTLVVGDAVYRLDLRSFDDMVYYVGELMRAPYTAAEGKANTAMDAQLMVRVSGLRGGGAGTPLFRISPAQAARDPGSYAAQVSYGGQFYVAGPPIGRSCAEASEGGLCQDDPAHGDRTSSVLSLLAELLALNQSPDSIRAPARLLVE